MTYPCQCRARSSAPWGRGGRISFVQSVEDRGRGRERHRRHRVNPLRGSSAGAAALAPDTAPTATGRLTMAGRVLPAIFGPAGRNTKRTSRAAMALSSNWIASWRTAGARDCTLGCGCRAAGDAQNGLVRYLRRVFGNQATVGLRSACESCGAPRRGWRAPGSIAVHGARGAPSCVRRESSRLHHRCRSRPSARRGPRLSGRR